MADETTRLAVLIEANTKSYERAMARMEQRTNQAMRRSTAAVTTLDSRMKGLAIGAGRALAAFGIGAGVLGFTAVARSISDAVTEADRLAKTADKIGLSTDELQELRFAADLSGVSMRQADMGLQRFSRRIAEAASGAGVLLPVLEANNVQLRDSDGSLRSNTELLGEYAELVKNAASEQDQLLLAFKAFDSEGAAMVNVLKNGAAGLDELRQGARDAGAAIDEDLLRRAEDLKNDWTELTTSLTTTWQTFVLSVVNGVVDARNALSSLTDNFERSKNVSRSEALTSMREKLSRDPDGPHAEAFRRQIARLEAEGVIGIRAGGDSFDVVPRASKGGGKPTVISDDGDGPQKAADQIQKVIEALEFQQAQLGRTAREQAIYNELQRAGVAINSEAGGAIAAITGKLYDQQLAMDANVAAMDEFRDAGKDALGSLVAGLREGKTAGEALGNALGRLADRLADSALQALLDNLLGAPGTPGGGSLASLLPNIVGGARAAGGPVSAGRSYLVGERGPEMFVPAVAGRVVPNAGAGGNVVNIKVVEAPGTKQQVSRGDDGSILIESKLDQAMASLMSKPGTKSNRTLRTGGFSMPGTRR